MVSLPNTESFPNTNAGASPPSLDEMIAWIREYVADAELFYDTKPAHIEQPMRDLAVARAALRVLEGCRRWVSYMETDEGEPPVDLYRIFTGLPELPSPPATSSEGE